MHLQCLSDVTIFELQSLLKAYYFWGKTWMVSSGYCQSVLLSIVVPIYPLLPATCRQQCMLSWNSLCTVWGSQGRQKRLCPQNIGRLCSNTWLLLLIWEVQTKRQAATVTEPPPQLLQVPPIWWKRLLKYLKDQHHLFFLNSFIFHPFSFGSQILNTQTCKSNYIYMEN